MTRQEEGGAEMKAVLDRVSRKRFANKGGGMCGCSPSPRPLSVLDPSHAVMCITFLKIK